MQSWPSLPPVTQPYRPSGCFLGLGGWEGPSVHSLREEEHFPDPRTTYSSPSSSSCLPFVRQWATAQRGVVIARSHSKTGTLAGNFLAWGMGDCCGVSIGKQFPASIPGSSMVEVAPRKCSLPQEIDHMELGWGRNPRKKWSDGGMGRCTPEGRFGRVLGQKSWGM